MNKRYKNQYCQHKKFLDHTDWECIKDVWLL